MLAFLWRDLIAMSVHEELAQAEGVKVQRVELGFILLIALMTAISMKIVGLLLITALLVIPAAAARRLARRPETMAVTAGAIAAWRWSWASWLSATSPMPHRARPSCCRPDFSSS